MTENKNLILALNPGSTSTKMAFYQDEQLIALKTVRHPLSDFQNCPTVIAQKQVRLDCLLEFLSENNVELGRINAIVGRGGLMKPLDSGVYSVNEKMLHDLSHGYASTHASALGGIIAHELGHQCGASAFIVDPVVVDEMEPIAKLSGIPGIERKSVFHALNTKAVTKNFAEKIGVEYDDGRFVVAHMGGGISIGAHRYGRVIDVSDAFNGEGPFSSERSGGVPLKPIIEMCFSGRHTKENMMGLVSGQGGLMAYLGTNDLAAVEDLEKKGDEFASLVMETMAYQITKEIGAMVAALEGQVDAIILTGGMAHSRRFTGYIKQRVDKIARVVTYPGEDEMLALAKGALRILNGQEKAVEYI